MGIHVPFLLFSYFIPYVLSGRLMVPQNHPGGQAGKWKALSGLAGFAFLNRTPLSFTADLGCEWRSFAKMGEDGNTLAFQIRTVQQFFQ